MMEFWITLALLVLVAILVWTKRKKIEVQGLFPIFYFVLYRTKWGLKWMDTFGKKHPKLLHYIFTFGVILGFIAMIWICYELIQSTIVLITQPDSIPGIMPVLPIEVKAIRSVTVPILYWIISIFVIAFVHEFSHGIAARHIKVKVKSSGLAALCLIIPIIPAAFVEPEEKQIVKSTKLAQMKVYAAGPLANILTAFLVLALVGLILNPILDPVLIDSGVMISRLAEDAPAAIAGLQPGDIITQAGGMSLLSVRNFSQMMDKSSPEDTISVTNTTWYFRCYTKKES